MATKTTTTTTDGLNTKTKWWTGFISVQTLVAIGTAIVFCVGFVIKVNNHDSDISQLKKDMLLRASHLKEQVQRQYEQFTLIRADISSIQKQQEYNKGVHDGRQELKAEIK